jgi:hypothetical protein
MTKLGWKLAVACAGLLLGGCGDKDDTGDTGNVDQPEYGVQAALWQPEDSEPAPDLSWSEPDIGAA